MKRIPIPELHLMLALTTAFIVCTPFHRSQGAERTVPAWTDDSAVPVMEANKKWQTERWSKSKMINLKAVNDLLDAGIPADAWQYQKLAQFAENMETCNLLAISAEGTAVWVTDKEKRVLALDGLLDTYRVSIRVRIDGVRDGLQKARKFSRLPDVRQAANAMLKMLVHFDTSVVTPRVGQLEQLQKIVGMPPK